ncbi:hypothetical protein H632_c322p0 [Helicosporidium sp. ATCC 50920]|nr:hypothetical protein H632_c322p0 [Helicosporidium sp. ATCC 50920]|eukprot:KDD76186.1 hypothetical protein H632_c322p0 [Helicosporidium sp. ATCC 50920]
MGHLVRGAFPFVALTVAGWLGVSQILQGRIDSQEAHQSAVSAHAPVSKQRAKAFDLASELERVQSSVDIDDYEYKSVPRPPEEE